MWYEAGPVRIILDCFHPVRQVYRSAIDAHRNMISKMLAYLSVLVHVYLVVEACSKAVVFILAV